MLFKAWRKRSVGSTAKCPAFVTPALKREHCGDVREDGEIEWWCLLTWTGAVTAERDTAMVSQLLYVLCVLLMQARCCLAGAAAVVSR